MEVRCVEVSLGQFHLYADFAVSNGITGLFGASGAGKTTLLEVIGGLRKPDNGKITCNGQTFLDTSRKINVPARRRNLGYVPQDLALFPHLNVLSNIRYGEKDASTSKSGASFSTICKILEIEKNLYQYPDTLSGGEKQRVTFARALMSKPSFLLLDEPLRGLDDALKGKLLSFLLQIRQEFAIPMLYVTHSPSEVMTLCDEVIVFDQGKLMGQGPPSDYFFQDDLPAYRLRRDLKEKL